MSIDLQGARAVITGGAGFIGSHIADQLVDAGAERITILDDFVRGRRENLAGALASGRLDLIDGDIRDAELVDRVISGSDVVFHQAALRITQCADEPTHAVQVMVDGTQNIVEAAVRHGVKKVVAASSASVYGEPQYLPMDELHPFNNRTLYGMAKIANEQLLRAYSDMHGLPYIALRPFNVYGPRMDVHGVYTEVMIRWLDRLSQGEAPVIFGDGCQTMDFVYVGDVAGAYLLAAQSDVTDEVFNVGAGIETSLRELCQILCDEMGQTSLQPVFQPARKVNPVTRRLASTERARDRIGFEAGVSLRDGIRRLIEWYSTKPQVEMVGAR
jgi:UDP-glucose 4-epimerase